MTHKIGVQSNGGTSELEVTKEGGGTDMNTTIVTEDLVRMTLASLVGVSAIKTDPKTVLGDKIERAEETIPGLAVGAGVGRGIVTGTATEGEG